MDLINNKKNQHFLSQTEQRLNAINFGASSSNQKIYSFSLKDRESYLLKLDDEKGKPISKNLSFYDLFSVDVLDHRKRMNFEVMFEQYEVDIRKNTESLLYKLETNSNIKQEILNIFVAKFLNFLRNPYSIKKVLNTIETVKKYKPTDQSLNNMYNSVRSGKKPQMQYLCNLLKISDQEYKSWLSALFMLLVRLELKQPNLMESAIIKGLYEHPSNFIMVIVYHYIGEHNNKRCLLSDRGFSVPLPEKERLSFDFNLCSNAFIRYIFSDVEKKAPPGTSSKILEAYKRRENPVSVHYKKNDLNSLSGYNKHVVYQCHNKVYCSSKMIYGL